MTDTTGTTTNADTNAAGSGSAANLANIIGQAVQAAVMTAMTTSMNEITAKLNSLEDRIKQTSISEDTGFEASVSGADDPFDDKRRAGIVHQKLALSMAENADALMKEYLKYTAGVWARSLDHFCGTNPDIPPRANKM